MDAYIDNRYIDVKVDFLAVNNKAKKEAVFSCERESLHSKIYQLKNEKRKQDKKIPTAETNQFLLDGSYELINLDDDVETGFRGHIVSDENGFMEKSEDLVVVFKNPHSSYGFTIYFDDKSNEYASEIIIEAYRQDSVVSSKKFMNDSPVFKSEFPVENYDKIIFRFTKTSNPFRKIRVTEVYFGLVEEFETDDLKELRLIRELSLENITLPFCETEIVINNIDKKYNMLNPTGIYKYLHNDQAMDIKVGIGDKKDAINYSNCGRYYFSEAKTTDNSITASIVARDKLSLLDKIKYPKTDEPLLPDSFENLIKRILSFSKIDIQYDIPEELKRIAMNIVTSQEITCKEALMLSCQAACCCCFFNKKDTLIFKEIRESKVIEILNFDKITEYPSIEVGEKYNTVIIRNSERELAKFTDKKADEVEKALEISNDFIVHNRAEAVARFILKNARILKYSVQSRGNPLLDIGDTINIYDAFKVNRNAIITKHELVFDGSLKEYINAQGVI